MFRTLKMLVSVPIIMACALGGTVGLLRAIEGLTVNLDCPKGPGEGEDR